MRAPRLQNWSPKVPETGKNEKVPNTECPKVEKLEIIKKSKASEVKLLIFIHFTTTNDHPQEV